MTREETIKKMMKLANEIMGKNGKNWTRQKEDEIWNLSLDYNRDHEDDEIFMCEYGDGDDVEGFMIEDDYWLYEDI